MNDEVPGDAGYKVNEFEKPHAQLSNRMRLTDEIIPLMETTLIKYKFYLKKDSNIDYRNFAAHEIKNSINSYLDAQLSKVTYGELEEMLSNCSKPTNKRRTNKWEVKWDLTPNKASCLLVSISGFLKTFSCILAPMRGLL